jgi:hypothetical protein
MGLRAGLDTVTRKNPRPCRDSKAGLPSRSLVTILTELDITLHRARNYVIVYFVKYSSHRKMFHIKIVYINEIFTFVLLHVLIFCTMCRFREILKNLNLRLMLRL